VTKTVEKQYEVHIKLKDRKGLTKLGVVRSSSWRTNSKRLLFEFSRYKFVAKMFSGKQNVLEVGWGDAFYLRIVK
jgi:hypothetical protein